MTNDKSRMMRICALTNLGFVSLSLLSGAAFGQNNDLCAGIETSGQCNKEGANKYAKNKLSNRKVDATIKSICRSGTETRVRDFVIEGINAGGRKLVGCTYYDTHPFDTRCSYEVIGCVPAVATDTSFGETIYDDDGEMHGDNARKPTDPQPVSPVGYTPAWDKRFYWEEFKGAEKYRLALYRPKFLRGQGCNIGSLRANLNHYEFDDRNCKDGVCSSYANVNFGLRQRLPRGDVQGGVCNQGSPYTYIWFVTAIMEDKAEHTGKATWAELVAAP